MANKIKLPNITARDFATILGLNPYQTAFQLLESKIEKKNMFFGNKFTEHGNKYEKEAIIKFSKKTGLNVISEQQNIIHPKYNWISGRVDGIVNEEVYEKVKRKRKRKEIQYILEVKCPLKEDREEELSEENIPIYYWIQCQVYMNMLDIKYTYYVEYYVPDKLYYIKIERDNDWWNNNISKIEKYYNEMIKYAVKGNLDEHPIKKEECKWINKILE